MGATTRGVFGVLDRLAPPPPADSDADLLDRYVRAADGDAFAALVRRHGPMVFAVCRRRLGRDADADDAFQAVFLALATTAAALRRRASLAGWLYRAAYLIALKAAGRRARRPAAPLPAEVPMPAPPPPAAEAAEVRAAVDAEVAALPDKLRAVVVLCLLEGRTNAEAAAVLGTPVGTIDSRLHAARQTLQARLTRRGVAVGLGLALDPLLGGPVGAAGPRLLDLMTTAIPAVLAEAARPGAGAVPPAVSDLARGVTAMTTKVRALAAVGLLVGVLGTAGAGAFLAAQEPKADAPPAAGAAQKADPPPKAGPPAAELKAIKGTAAVLDAPLDRELNFDGFPLMDLFAQVEVRADLIVRVDVAAFKRIGGLDGPDGAITPEKLIRSIEETRVILPRQANRLPIRDALADALAQVNLAVPCSYQVRGNQLVIVPAYRPPAAPGVDTLNPGELDEPSALEPRVLHEQIYGGVVAVTADRKPLGDILADLRRQTGANIVFDPRGEAQAGKTALTVSLTDVRLYDALRVIADMAELRMVYAGNIYYVTTGANARTFLPGAPRPTGFVPPVLPPGPPAPAPPPGTP